MARVIITLVALPALKQGHTNASSLPALTHPSCTAVRSPRTPGKKVPEKDEPNPWAAAPNEKSAASNEKSAASNEKSAARASSEESAAPLPKKLSLVDEQAADDTDYGCEGLEENDTSA
jgi:hypothetical protein